MGPMIAVVPPEMVSGLKEQDAQRIHIDSRMGTRVVRGMKLSAYLRSPAAFITRVTITRQDVIQYVANKTGGVHYDPSRARKQDERLSLLDAAKPTIETGTISNFTGCTRKSSRPLRTWPSPVTSLAIWMRSSGSTPRRRRRLPSLDRASMPDPLPHLYGQRWRSSHTGSPESS
jgi:hypothetical protein